MQIAVYEAARVEDCIVINAENYSERFVVDPILHSLQHSWSHHPLLEAAMEYVQIPEGLAF